ncbi:DNA polymerase IV [Leuconostoc palmae]|uniref:DNA polymerase IV n=1 Tax=Leuconostoc palmae TaxID=501487 RepID=UPI001C7DDF63|nr:DNA polymerase IV [Leuconostoc palmae]
MEEFLITNDVRLILHVDIDAFYAQVEMVENPELSKVPLIIAKDPSTTEGHGVVTTANYLARKVGVHSAMSSFEAKKLSPDAVFITPDFEKYKQISSKIHDIFYLFTKKVEPIAFDEAYLDITDCDLSGSNMAAKIRHEILKQTGLTSSIGVSHNKLLAKLGSEYNKPNGVTVITKKNMLSFLAKLPIQNFRGVGDKTYQKFKSLNITNGSQLRAISKETLKSHFGKMGELFYWQARGVHFGEVKWQRITKSVGKEETYRHFLNTDQQIKQALSKLAIGMITSLKKRELTGRTLNIKIRDNEFHTITRSVTKEVNWELSEKAIVKASYDIFVDLMMPPFSIRLLGMSMTNLNSSAFEEITLF